MNNHTRSSNSVVAKVDASVHLWHRPFPEGSRGCQSLTRAVSARVPAGCIFPRAERNSFVGLLHPWVDIDDVTCLCAWMFVVCINLDLQPNWICTCVVVRT